MAASRLPPHAGLSLKQFLQRSEVLKLYRDILRTLKRVPGKEQQEELKKWARHDIQNNCHHKDEEAIKMLLTNGRISLKELEKLLNLAS